MSKSRESSLKNSHYSPSIPLQEHQPEITPYCLLCSFFKAFTIILIAIGIVVLILWLVFQPDNVKVYIDDVSLTRFDLDTNDTLNYDLGLNVSLRNPNKKIGIHYERIRALASYNGTRFGQEDVARFHQHRKSTKMLEVRFKGRALSVGSGVAETYKREKGEGWLYVSVKMYTRVRLKTIIVNSVVYEPDVDCYLKIPVPINGTVEARGFERTECDVQSFS